MDKSKSRPKANAQQVQERIQQCLQWLGEGYTTGTILRNGSELWGITTRQVEEYYSRARDIVHQRFERSLPKLASDIADKLDIIYQKCMDDGDSAQRAIARQTIMDKAKLTGLLKDTVQITGELKTGYESETNDGLNQQWQQIDKP